MRKALLAALGAALLFAGRTGATVLPRLDLPDLARNAELILHGRILRHWSEWDAAHKFIWTHYILTVSERWKGQAAESVTISEPGGTAGGAVMKIAGAPEHADGEEVVVFLRRTPIGYWRCYGWEQGKYTVAQAADGRLRIRTHVGGVTLMDRRRFVKASPLTRLEGLELADFKRLVLREVER